MAALRSCAFTGHRPAHFSFQYDELAPGCVQLKSVLEKKILRLYHRGITDFYTGCALGVDLWVGEAALSLKRQNPDLQLHCIIPFEGQERRWKADDRDRYSSLLKQSYEVLVLSPRYFSGCYHARNRFLVDHTDVLLGVYDYKNEEPSGTGYTVHYALDHNKPVLLIHPETLAIYARTPGSRLGS